MSDRTAQNDEIEARAWRRVQPDLKRIAKELQDQAAAIRGKERRYPILRLAGQLIALAGAAEFERTGVAIPLNLPE